MSPKPPGNPVRPGAGSHGDAQHADGGQTFEALLAKPMAPRPATKPDPNAVGDAPPPGRIEGVVLGRFVGFDDAGHFLVDYAASPAREPVAAVAAVALDAQAIGRDVAISFIQGNPNQPVILGLLHQSSEQPPAQAAAPAGPGTVTVQRDEERLVLSAGREIVLQCGESSVTLTKAGKILIRGKYILSRSDGVNRIKGGAVQIN